MTSGLLDLAPVLAPNGELRAAINFGNTVLAQRGPTLEESRGASAAIARELARRLERPLRFVPFEGAGPVVEAAPTGVFDVCFLAIDPKRAGTLSFTTPYVLIEGGYLVRADSPITSVDEVDRPGMRLTVGGGSAYDLYLSRTLQHAEIVRAGTSADGLDVFFRENVPVAAGVKASLLDVAKTRSDVRVLPGRFMVIEQAMATVHGPQAAAALTGMIEELKASGFIARELAATGQTEATVAPPR
jgi:polar amino acid transport system substrate-binding protein